VSTLRSCVAVALTLCLASTAQAKEKKLTKEEKAKLPRVAILDFPPGPNAVECGGWGNHKEQMSDVLRDIFTTEISERSQGKLRLVERARMADIKGELEFQQSGDVNAATAQKLGKLLGAKYMLAGKITRFACKLTDMSTGWGVGALVGKATKNSLAGAIAGDANMKRASFSGRLDARLLEVETGEILVAFKDDSSSTDTSVKVAGGGREVEYDDELFSNVFEPLVKKMSAKVVKKTVDIDEEDQEEEKDDSGE
jgi:curli biogenesis system outer membrane secretion channel CsgG